MCELGVFQFFFFFENEVSKFGKVLKLIFLKAGQKRLQRIQNSVNSFTTAEFFAPSNVYNQCKISMRFYHSVFIYSMCKTKQRSNCCRFNTLTYCFRSAR